MNALARASQELGIREGRNGWKGYWQRKPNANLGALFYEARPGGGVWCGGYPIADGALCSARKKCADMAK